MNKWTVVAEYRGVVVAILYNNIPEWVAEAHLMRIWETPQLYRSDYNYVAYQMEG
jgi:hypothetical protein